MPPDILWVARDTQDGGETYHAVAKPAGVLLAITPPETPEAALRAGADAGVGGRRANADTSVGASQ